MNMDGKLQISGRLVARNTLFNFIGQIIPLFIGVVAIPLIIRGLAAERFGLLSIAWVILGYSTVFDLGLGRATTKFVAEVLGKGEDDEVPRLVWTAVTAQVVFGVAGGLALAGVTPLLVGRILNVPPDLAEEAGTTFYLLALSVPVALVSGSFSGALEAAQRFDLVNAVRIPSSCLTFLLPLLGVLLGLDLPGIVALILAARLGTLAAYAMIDLRLFPGLRKYASCYSLFLRLLSFGGWVMVSSIVGPILVYLDRFLIGSLLSMAAVAYYTAPYEAITRLWIIPVSLTTTLFPAFSALDVVKDKEKVGILFARSMKYVLLVLGPVILLVELFAEEVLQFWLGAGFAAKSSIALQILAVGVLVNSLAHTPSALLQSAARPDLPAKFHLLELPIYVGIAWFLIAHFGITGAAGAWTLRMALDTVLLFAAVFKIYGFSLGLVNARGVTSTGLALAALGAIGYVLKVLSKPFGLAAQALLAGGLLGLFGWFSWGNILDAADRRAIMVIQKQQRTAR
ncbi:MAG: flippase [Candidatus Methanomethyliaceae archaeon]